MEQRDFIKYLNSHKEEYEFEEGEHEKKEGIFVMNTKFDTKTHFSWEAVRKYDIETLLTETYQGRNTEQITRVTGFFSKVSGWNKGKRGELEERYRSGVGTK